MLVSLKWLAEYVDVPADVDAFARRLTMASAEVEGIHRVGGDWDAERVRVGRVLAVEAHPNADRLRLATVEHGAAEPERVVCGAPNLREGQRVAFAREGARLRDGRSGEPSTLVRATIRGVESAGMVLSERELGLSEEHEGILELPEDAPVGTPLVEYLGDTVLDVHVWPNRADLMSMVGIAREVAAIEGGAVRLPPDEHEQAGDPTAAAVSIAIADPELCARYVGVVIEGVRVGPSPRWMQERLLAAGMRPISNVVDITNYVLLELGQPLHAFDLDRLIARAGGGAPAIEARAARAGERLRTLDGEERELTAVALVIADGAGPVALAGVMGGADSEVTESTTRVLLESARFDPSSIRTTSLRLALRSESSARFERGLSPELAGQAARRATRLLGELAEGRARPAAIDVYPRPLQRPPIEVTRHRLATVTGLVLDDDEVERWLTTLGFEVGREPDGFVLRPPWWRTDVAIADDVAEEVVRLAGYDRLPATTIRGSVPPHEPQPLVELRERLRDALAAAGLREVISYSLTTREVLARVLPAETLERTPPLRLANTLSAERELMRPTLRHALLETVARNLRAGLPEVAIFEAARVYLPRAPGDGGGPLPDEREQVVGALAGEPADRWGGPAGRPLDFFDAKGVLEAALAELGVACAYEPAEEHALLPGRTARLSAGDIPSGVEVGVLGEVHPQVLAAFDIDRPVLLFELDLGRLLPHVPARRLARAVSRFPAVEQDLAVVAPLTVPAEALREAIARSPLVAEARIFDVYAGEQVPAGTRSVAFAIRYQAPDRTLTGEDAQREQDRIVRALAEEFDARQRSAAP